MNSSSMSSSPNPNSIESQEIEGNPWSVLPIKTRLFAKECTEIVLSNRKITKLINFEQFENLEALWLNHNKMEKIENLDTNFRLKILCLGHNRLTTLKGSLHVMKFVRVLFLNNNKLRNLDKTLSIMKNLSFLENLNLNGNPVAEEPEYRSRVIFFIPTLEILDRHKVTDTEKSNSEKVVLEFQDPEKAKNKEKERLEKERVQKEYELNRGKDKDMDNSTGNIGSKGGKSSKSNEKNKRGSKSTSKNAFHKFSTTEKELFEESDNIVLKYKALEELARLKVLKQLQLDDLPKGYAPNNRLIENNYEKYYRLDSQFCPELETNEMRRIFSLYDASKSLFYFILPYFTLYSLILPYIKSYRIEATGSIHKKELKFLFFDVKNLLNKNGVELIERKFMNTMIDFYSKSKELIKVSEIKKKFFEILHEIKSNKINEAKLIPDLDYIDSIVKEVKLGSIVGSTKNNNMNSNTMKNSMNNNTMKSTSKSLFKKSIISNIKQDRKDIFNIRSYADMSNIREIVLNENKLEAVYNK